MHQLYLILIIIIEAFQNFINFKFYKTIKSLILVQPYHHRTYKDIIH